MKIFLNIYKCEKNDIILLCFLSFVKETTMNAAKYDVFENEKEISKMIQSLQSKTKEYISSPNAWEFDTTEKKNNLS